MALERRLGSSAAASVRGLLEGNFFLAAGILDWLQEHRPEDVTFFRLLLGRLAVGALGRDGVPENGPVRPINSSDWEEFRREVLALFWFELYTPESTWEALSAACERVKDRPPLFGFPRG